MYTYKAKIISVYDGDTCRVDLDLGFNHWVRGQAIRWLGIDTPEMKGSDLPLGRLARDVVREMILGKEVYLQTHKAGKYGRWLGVFWLPEEWEACRAILGHDNVPFGASINQWLLDHGYAKELWI